LLKDKSVKGSFLFSGQIQHLLLLLLLVPGAFYLARTSLDEGEFFGVSVSGWFWAVILLSIVHQIIGWFVWRTQLVYNLFTRLFGGKDLLVWGIIFFPFLILRPVLSIGLGLADYGSLGQFRVAQIGAGLLLLVPVLYTGRSVIKYFGIKRALGADHFRAEYQREELVEEGAFRYSSNAMYSFAFLIFWSIALLTGSWLCLVTALFQHAYIWVHWYCTEMPDMNLIYGGH
jgi:protein-S-isoprenylcysteine O-methyltransferase Ste14